MIKNYKFLDDINFPSDVKKLSENRSSRFYLMKLDTEMINAVSETGGHLGAGLRRCRVDCSLTLCL